VAADWRRGFGRYGEDEADADVFEETMQRFGAITPRSSSGTGDCLCRTVDRDNLNLIGSSFATRFIGHRLGVVNVASIPQRVRL
jgi:hypothetical protein